MRVGQLVRFLFLVALFAACKKDSVTTNSSTTEIPVTQGTAGTRTELSKDSVFLYAKQIYLWNDAIPSYEIFNPRQYSGSTSLASYNSELYAISQLKVNPATGKPFEYSSNGNAKYSYISDLTIQNPTAGLGTEKSAVDLEGNGNDLGLKLGAYGTSASDANAYSLFVTAVYQNSPAAKAGMVRSDKITKVNGRSIGSNYANDVNFINSAFSGTNISLEGQKYLNGVAGSTFSVTLTKSVYRSSPVYAAKTFSVGNKKVGYLAYARFSNMVNSKAEIDNAFNDFSTAGVTDLIVDLRYNGGGYIVTAQYLIDQIAPASASGSVMFSEHYNPMMQNGQATILANQPLLDGNDRVQYQNGKMVTYADISYSVASNTEKFVKTGPLRNITSVVFIVSGNTASASELVINSLKPYMNVKLVGTKTYGKPVGFFPVRIENRYDVFLSLFQTKNAAGSGDYFEGFTPDVVDTFDDPRYNFGDSNENYTAKALALISPSTTTATTTAVKTMSIQGSAVSVVNLSPMKPLVDGNEFVGMIETTHKLKN